MIIEPARRTRSVEEYYFSRKNQEIARLNADRAARGLGPVINLGIGSPDGMPPQAALDALTGTAVQPDVHGYQPYTGVPALREAFADWYARYYGVTLDPRTDIQPLTGSKEGILLLSLAFLNPGDKALVPDPGYPTYTSATRMAGGEAVPYDLRPDNGWQPDFEALEAMDLSGVKLLWVNYPHMPTGARASRAVFEQLVAFGRHHGILIVHDNPYSFILNDTPLSLLSVPGAREVALELNSLSKAHNMAGWRIGMVAGAADAIHELLKVKSQMDSGMFRSLQCAAIEALRQGPEWYRALNETYANRRVWAGHILDALGAAYDPDSAGLFLFGRVDAPAADGKTPGEVVSDLLLSQAGVFLTPGIVFGRNGASYIRISLCAPVEVLQRALGQILSVVS